MTNITIVTTETLGVEYPGWYGGCKVASYSDIWDRLLLYTILFHVIGSQHSYVITNTHIVQLGLKLNTKLGLNHHPPQQTFLRGLGLVGG